MLTVYKASAGSGKTYTLAQTYIRLLLGEKRGDGDGYSLRKGATSAHRHILAITFTNKATEEMKSRIVEELALLAGVAEGKPSYMESLVEEFGCTEDELRVLSRKTLHQMLFDFNFFNISTIDSFFQTILRTFAREAELSGDYELSLDGSELMAESVQRFFDSLSQNSGDKSVRRTVKSISSFLIREFNDGKSVMLFDKNNPNYRTFLKRIEALSSETFIKSFSTFSEFFADEERVERFETALFNRMKLLRGDMRKEGTQAVKEIRECEGGGAQKFKVVLVNALEILAEKGDSDSTVIPKVVENGGRNYCIKKYADEVSDRCIEQIERACRTLIEGKKEIALLKEVRDNMFYLTLMAQVHKYMAEYRKDNNALMLSDTNSIVHSIIEDEDTPFIYERLGLRLNHYLIDEFQDTSRMQWENLRPLVAEGLSLRHDSLVIGDEKQCIYRFRNSDPTLLQHEVVESFGYDCEVCGNDPSRNKNWRSSADVVEFNNRLFRAMAAICGAEDVYANVEQGIPDKNKGHRGYICATPVECKNNNDYADYVLPRLAADIESQLDAGYRPSDIAILVRGNEEGARIISYLVDHRKESRHDYNIVSDELMRVSDSPAVNVIVSTLRSIAMPSGDDYTGKTYKNRRDTMFMVSRFKLYRNSGCDVAEALDRAVCEGCPAKVEGELSETITDIVEDIISGLDADMVAQQNSFICAFHDIVADYSAFGLNDIRSFLRWWDDKGYRLTISAPADPNAILVMTIHKSKGLEFKCVHLPFIHGNMVKLRNEVWFENKGLKGIDAEQPPMLLLKPTAALENTPFEEEYRQMCASAMLDELNVLYVGFTRAVDELILHYKTESEAGELVGSALQKVYSDKINADGQYVVGSPTAPPAEGEPKQMETVETLSIKDYPTYKALNIMEGSSLDDDPEGVEA
ncbi:MAG: UvrD-helicase domain-containing protein [Muribaculaceae bacterium]|nr:UvrD-helicase domain-containing protein [Muribaculaceae bacterium]